MQMHRALRYFLALLLLSLFLLPGATTALRVSSETTLNKTQTKVDGAQHIVNSSGIPMLKIEGVGTVEHPAWTALYALAYAGIETYDESLNIQVDPIKFQSCTTWLKNNLKKNKSGLWVWEYNFNSTYNDLTILAPWSSSFGQAVGIQALLAAYKINEDRDALAAAKKASVALLTPISEGGLLFEQGEDLWIEEIPIPEDNPSHILNGHMRALLALHDLAKVSDDTRIERVLKKGLNTLLRWLPAYDTGYWLRYDLNPKKDSLLFRFANPYGGKSVRLAVDEVRLIDPTTKRSVIIDVGSEDDATGSMRIAGTDWGAPEIIDGRTVRRLKPSALEVANGAPDSPNTYFYLYLPSHWTNNLRTEDFELEIKYFDDVEGPIAVQQRSIAPGISYRNMKDGDLLLSGNKVWRSWKIPLRVADLGYPVGYLYAQKHAQYLSWIADWDGRFNAWATRAAGYQFLASPSWDEVNTVKVKEEPLPTQTPMLPEMSLDEDGVLMQWAPHLDRENNEDVHDTHSRKGVPVYSPYVIASQVLTGRHSGFEKFMAPGEVKKIHRNPALDWLLDPDNYRVIEGANIYTYNFHNAYNNIVSEAPWPSAFGQAYVLGALTYARTHHLQANLDQQIRATAKAYDVSVESGGITTIGSNGLHFYEEVPNETHVLNAHLVSVEKLNEAATLLSDADIAKQVSAGVKTLRERLNLFDTGYWLRYDTNPKVEMLFQIDWLEGKESPLIESISLLNPETKEQVSITVDKNRESSGPSKLAGADWGGEIKVGKSVVQGFKNGYLLHKDPVQGGTRQNVYFILHLPSPFVGGKFSGDLFDVPTHLLKIHYKDVSKGAFRVGIRTINRGDRMEFIPLRGGVWRTYGDQQWKDAYFQVRPQDMGWFKGPDYQVYEVSELRKIGALSKDWFFTQYADRQEYYLQSDIIKKWTESELGSPLSDKLYPVVESSSPVYKGFGFENSLDSNVDGNYTAGIDEKDQHVILKFHTAVDLSAVKLIWENDKNRAGVTIRRQLEDGDLSDNLIKRGTTRVDGRETVVKLENSNDIKLLRIDFSNFEGQSRVLLRKIQLFQ